MNDGFIKSIDGEMFYRYDYADFLYQELQKRDDKINKAIEYIENNFIDYESAKAYITYDEMLEIPILDLRELLEILRGEE